MSGLFNVDLTGAPSALKDCANPVSAPRAIGAKHRWAHRPLGSPEGELWASPAREAVELHLSFPCG